MFIKGFTYGFDGKRGDYRTEEAAASTGIFLEHGPSIMDILLENKDI